MNEAETSKSFLLSKEYLRQSFYGSEHWLQARSQPQGAFTDGAKHVADMGGAYWLLDEIALIQPHDKAVAAEGFRCGRAPTFNFTQGLVMNQNHGLALIYATVQQQAELLAYNDVYRTLAILAAVFVPAFLLLRRAKGTTASAH
jgi:hypothetical protein